MTNQKPLQNGWKSSIQAFFRDVAEILHPVTDFTHRLWAFFGPRINNRALWGAMFMNLTVAASGEEVWHWLGQHKLIALAIIGYNLVTPLTPSGAPSRLPPSGRSPAMGPGAQVA